MEMLIVAAIIAILAVISIPVYKGTFVPVKRATDESNLRNAYVRVLMKQFDETEEKVSVSEPLVSEGEEISFPNCEVIKTKKGARVRFTIDADGSIEWTFE